MFTNVRGGSLWVPMGVVGHGDIVGHGNGAWGSTDGHCGSFQTTTTQGKEVENESGTGG